MKVLQKRLAQIGTEPHENGLCDGIVFEDNYNRHYWIFNHYSFYEWLKHYMVHYAGLSWEQATERLAQTRWNEPPETEDELGYTMHELTYDLAMEIVEGDKLWQNRTSSDSSYSIKEEYSWYEEIKEKYQLNEEYESFDFLERLLKRDNYEKFSTLEIEKSHLLAEALKVGTEERIEIGKCFDFLLKTHQKCKVFDEQMKEKNRVLPPYDTLKEMFDTLPSFSPVADIYILAKVLFYDNIMNTDYLKGHYIGYDMYLGSMYLKKQETTISVTEMLSISDYLKESPVIGENGTLVELLLKLIEKNALEKQWTAEQEAYLLQNILVIHQKINYCDTLKHLNQIFKYVHKGSLPTVFNSINKYKSQYRQGGMQMLEIILHTTFSKDIYQDFELKRALVSLFSEAGREYVKFRRVEEASMKSAFLEKWKNIKPSFSENILEDVFKKVEDLKHYKVLHLTQDAEEINFGVADTLAKSFLKGIQWIREELTGISYTQSPLEDLFDQKTEGNIDLKTYLLKKKELETMLNFSSLQQE